MRESARYSIGLFSLSLLLSLAVTSGPAAQQDWQVLWQYDTGG